MLTFDEAVERVACAMYERRALPEPLSWEVGKLTAAGGLYRSLAATAVAETIVLMREGIQTRSKVRAARR